METQHWKDKYQTKCRLLAEQAKEIAELQKQKRALSRSNSGQVAELTLPVGFESAPAIEKSASSSIVGEDQSAINNEIQNLANTINKSPFELDPKDPLLNMFSPKASNHSAVGEQSATQMMEAAMVAEQPPSKHMPPRNLFGHVFTTENSFDEDEGETQPSVQPDEEVVVEDDFEPEVVLEKTSDTVAEVLRSIFDCSSSSNNSTPTKSKATKRTTDPKSKKPKGSPKVSKQEKLQKLLNDSVGRAETLHTPRSSATSQREKTLRTKKRPIWTKEAFTRTPDQKKRRMEMLAQKMANTSQAVVAKSPTKDNAISPSTPTTPVFLRRTHRARRPEAVPVVEDRARALLKTKAHGSKHRTPSPPDNFYFNGKKRQNDDDLSPAAPPAKKKKPTLKKKPEPKKSKDEEKSKVSKPKKRGKKRRKPNEDDPDSDDETGKRGVPYNIPLEGYNGIPRFKGETHPFPRTLKGTVTQMEKFCEGEGETDFKYSREMICSLMIRKPGIPGLKKYSLNLPEYTAGQIAYQIILSHLR